MENTLETAPFHKDVADGPPSVKAYWLKTQDGLKIRAAHWKSEQQKNGTIFIFQGRSENLEKYGLLTNALVAQNYAASARAVEPGSAGEAAMGAAKNFMETLQQSEAVAMDAMTKGGDPHALVQALAQTELAVQTAVTVRDKVVEAYQEILRMPI